MLKFKKNFKLDLKNKPNKSSFRKTLANYDWGRSSKKSKETNDVYCFVSPGKANQPKREL